MPGHRAEEADLLVNREVGQLMLPRPEKQPLRDSQPIVIRDRFGRVGVVPRRYGVRRHLDRFDAAFDEILRDLRTQYLIGFYPKDVPLTKDPFHRIEIRPARPELRVVSRSGYYGEAQASNR